MSRTNFGFNFRKQGRKISVEGIEEYPDKDMAIQLKHQAGGVKREVRIS
jgi:hypothetical protein